MTGDLARIVLGTAQLGLDYGVANRSGRPAPTAAIEILRAATDAGVGAISTSPAYGQAEELIAAARVTTPVHTKLDPDLAPAASVTRSLRRLGRDHLDLVLIDLAHVTPDRFDAVLDGARSLVGHTVGAVGLSGYEPAAMAPLARSDALDVVQLPGSVVDRRVFEAGLHGGAGPGPALQVRSVLLQGALSLGADELPPHLRPLGAAVRTLGRVAASHAMTVAGVAMRWVLDHADVTVVIGVENMDQLAEIIEVANAGPLPGAARAALDGLGIDDLAVIDPRRWPRLEVAA